MVSLLERHLDEAAFLWSQREAAARASNHDLASLAHLDERVEAQIDGLRLGGPAAWDLCKAELDSGPSGADAGGIIFALAAVALGRGDLGEIAGVMEVAQGSPALEDGAVSALGWVPIEQARPVLARLLSNGVSSSLRCIGVAGAAARRIDPGTALDDALGDSDAKLAAVAAEAAGVLGDPRRADAVRALLGADDARGRAAAAWSGALLRDAAAEHVLPELALGYLDKPLAPLLLEDAFELAALVGDPGASARDLSKLPPRQALRFAGASGDVRHVGWLIERLGDAELGRPAGEAFAMITGADLSRPPLRGAAPAGFVPFPNDDPADARVGMDPDIDLPWAEPNAVAAWWAGQTAQHANGGTSPEGRAPERRLCGQPHGDDWLMAVLQRGHQRERAVAALALKLRRPGRPLFAVRAPAQRQARALGVAL